MAILNPKFGMFRAWNLELTFLFSRFKGSIEGIKERSRGVLSEWREATREQRGNEGNFIGRHLGAVNFMFIHSTKAVQGLQFLR